MLGIYVGICKETEDGIPESDLRQHVCPSCGNVDILTGDAELDKDVKPILAGDFLDEGFSFYRCAGGFGEFAYRYLPHKCTACGARFTAVKKCDKEINKTAIGWIVEFAFLVAVHIALSMVLIAYDVPVWLAPLAILVPLFVVYAKILSKIDENTYDKDPGPEYICEHGLSDAAFRRLEIAYDERLKDLKAKEVFSDEELEELIAAEDLVDAIKSVDEPKETDREMEPLKQQLQAQFGNPLPELLKQRLQAQPYYIFQGVNTDGQPLIFPQPTIRPWDIHPW